jgi:deoxyribodipyrimidine photo-lyase
MKPLLSSNRSILGMNGDTVRYVVNAASHKKAAGEGVALERLCHFVGTGAATNASRNLADVSGDSSSKLSVHLSLGTISPRTMYHAAMAAGETCSWLASHLEMRDFFLYTAWSAGVKLYSVTGVPIGKKKETVQWQTPTADTKTLDAWRKWALGGTNLPLVDAALRELLSTGYCSNRVRQNAASFLAKDLGIDWRAGAEWFQFLLEDHSVGVNWGNWMYFSGVGGDPKHRHFRTISQALKYDPDGAYVAKWLPKLEGVSNVEARLRPWEYLDDWASPIVDPDTQLTWTDLQELRKNGRLCQGGSTTP